jgi:ribosomal protein L11 methyltransferase
MWRVHTAVVPSSVEDEVASVLGGGSLGVEIAPAGPGASLLRVYLGRGDDVEAWRRRAARILEAHGVAVTGSGITVEPVADLRWVERWQASLAPIPLGRRFIVLPAGPAEAAGDRTPIVLVPGMAFGTGEHETTRLCAAAIERLVATGSRWIDVGTGTGILAAVAAFCGAAYVRAVDSDPEAAHVASEVVAANALDDRIEVLAGSIDDRGGERFDGLVANIQSSFFLTQARAIADAVKPSGWLVVSGIVSEDAGEVADRLSGAGFVLHERMSDGPWACLIFRAAAA